MYGDIKSGSCVAIFGKLFASFGFLLKVTFMPADY